MSAHGDYQPEETRKKISHPVIDGDGHWIEYTPVFAEKMRKVVGDKGADGFIAAQRRIPDSLSLTIEERKKRGAGMEGYWGRQSTNTRDRATAMMPRMLYDRLDELGIDFGIVYPAAGHAGAKGLFLGVVTRRFPDLRCGVLEGGVGWGCQLFADLIEHWERRGAKGIAYMNPEKLDRQMLRQLVDKYGYEEIAAELQQRDGWPMKEEDSLTGNVPVLDDYAACEITRKQDWIDLYVTPFFFGCEADDRLNAVAFSNFNPFGAKINAIYSSDIGHFDVPDMRMVLPEAYELVEHGFITKDDFHDFTFGNAVRLWGAVNPRFFEGTKVAKEAADLLKTTRQPVLQDAAK